MREFSVWSMDLRCVGGLFGLRLPASFGRSFKVFKCLYIYIS